jgi:hypothetical protein
MRNTEHGSTKDTKEHEEKPNPVSEVADPMKIS